MSDSEPSLTAAFGTLLPRFLGHGVDYSEFVRTTSSLRGWSDWLPAWVSAGEAHREIGDEALAGGRTRTAGESYVRAATYIHFAKFQWTEDAARYRATTIRSVELHRQGMALLDPTFRRLEIPFDRDRIVANVRLPGGSVKRSSGVPFVILVPGLDSTKEEFPVWEDSLLSRGLATVTLDGPGQGEAGFVNPIGADYERPVGALLDALETRTDLGLDLSRAGITGIGMGGYYASRAAAFEPRVSAVGVVGGPYRFARMPPRVRAKFLFSAMAPSEREAALLADTFTLDRVAERIEQPYLVIHGARDAVMPPAEIERHAHAAPHGEFHLYAEGSTACQSVSHLFRPRLADWFVTHLAR